ncbi:MAG: toprim domain-containing protein [Firmicutes bacterium]|nr:toprim domain-containing protein [Bacillota bacterium]
MVDQDLIKQARQADLAAYLLSRGENLKRVGSNYMLAEHDSLRIKGNMYYWNSKGTHGNSVDFLREYYNMTFQEAVEALTSHASNIGNVSVPPTTSTPQSAAQPPQRANDEKRAIAYLCKRRGLDSSIVFSLIKSGKLWQDTHGNCNFQICDWQEQPIGAEIVGTGDTRYKQTTAHSGYGFHLIIGEPDTAMYFESAIDLLSCYQIHKEKLTHHILVSMGGLNSSIVNELHKTNPQLRHFLCVDNDVAGDNFINDIRANHIEIGIFRPTSGKDWNEYLIDFIQKK